MEELKESPLCFNCKGCAQIQTLPCQIHYICELCVEENKKDGTELKNLFCQCLVASTSQKTSPLNDSAVFNTESILDSLPRLKHCTLCKHDVPDAHVQFCRECLEIFCFNCCIQHRIANESKVHTISPFSSQNKPYCCKHNKEADFFCANVNCNKSFCNVCIKFGHKHQELGRIEQHAESHCDSVLKMIKSNDEKSNEVSFLISTLITKRNKMNKTVKHLELDLEKRRDCILQIVEEEFRNQSQNLKQRHAEFIRETREEMQKLMQIQADLDTLSALSLHYSDELPNYNILRDYFAFGKVYYKKFTLSNSIQFNTLAFAKSKFESNKVQDAVKTLIGEIRTFVDEDSIVQNVTSRELPFLTSVEFCDLKKLHMTDICYDIEREFLYVLSNHSNRCCIFQVSKGKVVEMLKLKIHLNFMHISTLLSSRILLQTPNDFKLLSITTKRSESMGLPQWFPLNVLAMCVSPCKQFLFFCFKDYSVCKYNITTKFSETAPISLPNDCLWMSVSRNLDYIVFTGRFHTIYLFSFNQKIILHIFNDSLITSYKYATFLTENIFVAFDSATSSLIIFSAEKKRFIRKITHFVDEKWTNSEDIGRVSALTAGTSNTLFVNVVRPNANKIIKVMFN